MQDTGPARPADEFRSDIEAIACVPTILDVVRRVTGLGFAAVARVTEDRWVCLAADDQMRLGLEPGSELEIETTLCHEVHHSRSAIVIDHVSEDDCYRDHRTPAMYGFKSYISVPIFLKDESFYGTLCALDSAPAKLTDPAVTGMFRLFADLIGKNLDTVGRLKTTESHLVAAQTTAKLRDRFIAMLGHDLRSPLGAIASGANLLERASADEKTRMVAATMAHSVARMPRLIDDVMDLAMGQLGSGIALARSRLDVEAVLRQCVEEMRMSHPGRRIDAAFAIAQPIHADGWRIGRLLSNLLSNALSYGAADAPVRVEAATDGMFTLSVSNAGAPIPPDAVGSLFLPFTRGAAAQDRKGLGLGLYIVKEIASAHGGSVEVASTSAETRFTFRMPLDGG